MKTKITLITLALIFSANFLIAQIHKYAPEVYLVGVGEKNATLDESKFPNLKFFYTPELIADAEVSGQEKVNVSGEPEFLKNLWNDKNMKGAFMLFDKNGVCVAQGYDIMRQNDIGGRLCADQKSLNDHLISYVKKEKTGKESSKEMKLKKSDFMVGHKINEFNVVSLTGEKTGIKTLTESGKPALVIFFQIPKDFDLNAVAENTGKKKGKAFLNAMSQGAAGSKYKRLFVQLESEFFQYDARQK